MDYTKSGLLIRDVPKKEKSLKYNEHESPSPSSPPEIFGRVLLEYAETELSNFSSNWVHGNRSSRGWNETFGNGSSADGENLDEAYVPYTDRPETYIVPVLFAIIFIVGVVGNGTLILIFLRHRTMRNVPNM
jgi:hypothetical protein